MLHQDVARLVNKEITSNKELCYHPLTIHEKKCCLDTERQNLPGSQAVICFMLLFLIGKRTG